MPGKVLVGQAGGATAVINASLVGVVETVQASGRFDAVWGMRRGAEGALQGEFADLTHLTPAELERIAATPGAALASSRHKVTADEIDTLLNLMRQHEVRTFLYIGGNDSADTCHRIASAAQAQSYDLRAIAVPKTIDNDLPVTDHCPGYGSIARYIAVSAMDSAKDTESMPTMYPVKIIEVMGRDAGWVVAASALGARNSGDPPHLLYTPERRLSRDQLLRDVRRVHAAHGYVVAVVAETIRDERGNPFADPSLSAEVDAFGHRLLRGTADAMCRLIQSELGLRSRFDKPGSLQRMSMALASVVDLAEAREVGRAAVRLALQDQTDVMVTLIRDEDEPYASHTDSTPLANIANKQRLLPDEFLTADGHGVSDAFRSYALPLLGPDSLPTYSTLP